MYESMYTPSNSTEIRFPAAAGGSEKASRYQPSPPGRKPVPEGVLSSVVGVSSMLQSCGTLTGRQSEASYDGSAGCAYAPVGSVAAAGLTSANRQPSVSGRVRARPLVAGSPGASEAADAGAAPAAVAAAAVPAAPAIRRDLRDTGMMVSS